MKKGSKGMQKPLSPLDEDIPFVVEASRETGGSDTLLDMFLGCFRQLADGSKTGFIYPYVKMVHGVLGIRFTG